VKCDINGEVSTPDHESDLLIQARARAQRLVYELEQQASLGTARQLDREQLQQGEEAMRQAVASARQALAAIEAAIELEQNLPEDSEDDRDRS
jgi:hypothetical protein